MSEIRTDSLMLRPYRSDEGDLIGRLMHDDRVFFRKTREVTETGIAEVLARSTALRPCGLGWFGVFKAESGDFAGNVVLQSLPETEEIEVGYHPLPDYWGNDSATEAARALIRYGFLELGLQRIVAVVLRQNDSSARVLNRLGLSYIEDRINADLRHRYFALHRSDYLAEGVNVNDQPKP